MSVKPFENLGDPHADLTDPDNPEWTDEDFAKARPASELPNWFLDAFPNTKAAVRGAQKTPTKAPVSIRLDPDVLDHFRSGGPGWQSRINATLRQAMKATG